MPWPGRRALLHAPPLQVEQTGGLRGWRKEEGPGEAESWRVPQGGALTLVAMARRTGGRPRMRPLPLQGLGPLGVAVLVIS